MEGGGIRDACPGAVGLLCTTTQYTITRQRPYMHLLCLPPPHLLTHSEPPTTCCPLPVGPATSSKPRPLYKYHVLSSPTMLHTSHPAYEDGTDRVFRNVGIQQSDAGEIPKRIHTWLLISVCHLLLLSTYFKSYLSTAWNQQLIRSYWMCYIAIATCSSDIYQCLCHVTQRNISIHFVLSATAGHTATLQ